MNHSKCCAIMVVSAVMGSGMLKADWADYKPSTLETVWSEATILKGADYTIEAKYGKYVVEVSYTGEHQEISAERRKLIRGWAKAVGQLQFAEMFEHEIAVQAGSRTFWLPLQNPLVESFVKEAGAGSRLKLYVVYIGAVKEDRVVVVNEFQVLTQ